MTKAMPELPCDPPEEQSGSRRSVVWMVIILVLVAIGSYVVATRIKPGSVVDSLPSQVEIVTTIPVDRNYNEVMGLIIKLTRRTAVVEGQQRALFGLADTTLMAVDRLDVLYAALGTSVNRVATDVARHKLWAANRAERADDYFLELVRAHNALVELLKELSVNLHEHSGYHH